MKMHLVASVTPHPSYNANNWKYHPADLVDLAVIRLQTHVVFHGDVKIGVLVSEETAHVRESALVFGFGPTSASTEYKQPSTSLKSISVDIESPEKCMWSASEYYEWNTKDNQEDPVPYLSFFDPDHHVCHSITSSSRSPSCSFEGGNPLTVKADGDMYILGVYSGFAPGGTCAQTKTDHDFDNYARYASLLYWGSWVQEVTGVLLPSRYPESTNIPNPTPPPSQNTVAATCQSRCGQFSQSHTCWCDKECKIWGDCCDDYETKCSSTNAVVTTGDGCDTEKRPGICGYKSGTCWCDGKCLEYGDCCDNYPLFCGQQVTGAYKTCHKRCGAKANGCWCDADCVTNQDCCPDYSTVCESAGEGFNSCFGKCGEKAGTCWCDPGCVENGDCCPNYQYRCGSLGSCEGYCGRMSTDQCWCDASCMESGDCCSDFDHQCPDTHFSKEVLDKNQNGR